jgi:hypothetical protein
MKYKENWQAFLTGLIGGIQLAIGYRQLSPLPRVVQTGIATRIFRTQRILHNNA